MQIHYKIEFFSYWHASSGLSGGAYADSLVIKDRQNLPYLPGRTAKGLLRDSALRIFKFSKGKLINVDFIEKVFGSEPTQKQKDEEDKTKEAEAFFSNAKLSDFIKAGMLTEKGLEAYFYKIHAATSIDDNGVAVDHSLRQMEVVVPITLYGTIEDFPEGDLTLQQLKYCMQGVKRLGLNRSRGLGRCKFSIINNRS